MGWHEDEFRFMGVPFEGRGRRGDEAIRLVRALWRGEASFEGSFWSFEDASFAPLPEPPPELWMEAGPSARSALRSSSATSGTRREASAQGTFAA